VLPWLTRVSLLLVLPRLLAAQGITTAAITGAVTRQDGSPIPGSAVTVTHQGNGRRWEIVTNSSGRFLLEDVTVGGPYRIEARAIGFDPAARTDIILALGQRLVADFALKAAPLELPELSVSTTLDPALDRGRTGPAEIIDATTIARLPNPRRDFLHLALLSPQAASSPSSVFSRTGGIVIGGQSRMMNSFRIDGGLNHDLYRGGLPGRETLPRPISLEALEEIQVHAAPFDVRHAGFTGGLVNAVTKSGSNTVHGSAFVYLADRALVGKNAAGDEVGDFTTWQLGGSVSGPLIRDRAHYYLNLDLQRRTVADPGPLITDTVGGADTALIGISYASVARFQGILRDTYGLDPGRLGPVDAPQRAEDVFGKVSLQLGTNSHLEASHHYRHGDVVRSPERHFGLYALSTLAQRNLSATHSSRLIWTSLLGGRWSNDLIMSYIRVRDRCEPAATYPRINVLADRGQLSAGPGARCPTESFGQDVLEATENLTIGLGDHVVTIGARGELLHFDDGVLVSSPGAWRFRDLDALGAGRAFSYSRAFYGSADSGGVDFRVRQIGVYAQDRWTPTRGLTLTAGLRLDVPFLPDPIPTNAALQSALAIDTGELPSGNLLWSPRLGVNYDLRGEGRTFVRGGVGLFSGHPPYTWVGSAYHDSGRELLVTCTGPQVPAFDPINQPVSCAEGARAFPQLSFFEPGVNFPRTLKMAVGVDRRLPGDAVGTLDLLYTRGLDQLYLSDANLGSPVGVARGEGGRPLYGTFGSTGTPVTTARLSPAFRTVIRVSNRSGDEAVSLSAQLRKRFGRGFEGGALYTYTRARDRMSFIVFETRGNLDFTPLDGTLEDRRLTTSVFEIPHRVHAYGMIPLPFRAMLSLTYSGASGTPFTYVIDGDANADGLGSLQPNDVVYVPKSVVPGGDVILVQPDAEGGLAPASAAEYTKLERFIQADPCLRHHRGRLLSRNSCRNPWFGSINARLSKAIPTMAGQSLELTVDLYNLLNLINRKWGQYRVTFSNNPSVPMLRLVGYDNSGGRGVYQLALPERNEIQDFESRWQTEISVRYVF
jgi:Carboxypeptidase regulatory-like domain/TonB dependent receptor